MAVKIHGAPYAIKSLAIPGCASSQKTHVGREGRFYFFQNVGCFYFSLDQKLSWMFSGYDTLLYARFKMRADYIQNDNKECNTVQSTPSCENKEIVDACLWLLTYEECV